MNRNKLSRRDKFSIQDPDSLQKALNKSKPAEASSKEKAVASILGICFLVTLIVLAVFFSEPKPFQYLVFRSILALAAAGVGALIPGFIHIEIKPAVRTAIRAGGALGIFVVVYFANPASLVSKQPQGNPDKSATADSSRMNVSIGGIVVDESNQQAIGQATITVVGRSETDTSEDSGNFRIDLKGDVPKRIRLRVIKNGFQPKDLTVEPPRENLIVQMQKQ